MERRRISIIANRASLNCKNLRKYESYLIHHLTDCDVLFYKTSSLLELEDHIKNSLQKNIREYVVIGGDGSIHHLANFLLRYSPMNSNIKLSIIPRGTGNDYIRNFKFFNEQEILDAIKIGKYKKVDIGLLLYNNENRYFINMLGVGFSAAVVKKLPRYKWLGGISYYLALLDAFFTYQAQIVELEIDNEYYKFDCFQLSIGIGKYAGNNMKLCPNAEIDDGLFDVNCIEKVSLWKLLRYSYSLRNGSYLQYIPSKCFKAKSVKMISATKLLCESEGEKILLPKEIKIQDEKIEVLSK